jgi:hypothetical protein
VAMALGQDVWLLSQHAHYWSHHHAATSRLERAAPGDERPWCAALHAAHLGEVRGQRHHVGKECVKTGGQPGNDPAAGLRYRPGPLSAGRCLIGGPACDLA